MFISKIAMFFSMLRRKWQNYANRLSGIEWKGCARLTIDIFRWVMVLGISLELTKSFVQENRDLNFYLRPKIFLSINWVLVKQRVTRRVYCKALLWLFIICEKSLGLLLSENTVHVCRIISKFFLDGTTLKRYKNIWNTILVKFGIVAIYHTLCEPNTQVFC